MRLSSPVGYQRRWVVVVKEKQSPDMLRLLS
jgi:hypothetical protein